MSKEVLIGGAGAFIGDSILGPMQLVDVPGMQYLVFDYLAEMTLAGFVRAQAQNPDAGYAEDFVHYTLPQIAKSCAQRGIRIVTNAGGINPAACAAAVTAVLDALGVDLRVAYVTGDSALALMPALRRDAAPDFYHQGLPPQEVASANLYLGAPPIAKALSLDADIVITGRVVDSATTLGILMHEFQWADDDWDRLAMGALAGHLLECGAQVTGGLFTDWERVPNWANIGYPFARCHEDGRFTIEKPAGTGGKITPRTVAEQVLYEVADPTNYVLPDVVCDFSHVQLSQAGQQVVAVANARGKPRPATYKLSAAYRDGYRCVAELSVFGFSAIKKARRTGQALLTRIEKLLADQGLPGFSKALVTVIGAEDYYGPHARVPDLREAVARIAVISDHAETLELFSREVRAPGVSFGPATTSGSALTLNSRAPIEPVYKLYTALVEKSRMPAPVVAMADKTWAVEINTQGAEPIAYVVDQDETAVADDIDVSPTQMLPLVQVAHARSGDKGNTSNIAIFARDVQDYEHLKNVLTPARLRQHLRHLVSGRINRYLAPGMHAINFVIEDALDGGGPSSLRPDPMGKGLAQMVLAMEIPMPPA